ncbi:MAG: 2-hydroxychromene-2-carboxylate isomerase [Alphaproteobacteria bacterium]|jgi:2-hydroxychromene-2-carboxylate isomerase|nr:2-hydroxychromene-2-carboxylate isomerase [Alphaproteobacteria bacterium]
MPAIEYFYSAHSAFAYLGSARLMQIAGAAGATIVHKPVNLLRVMVESSAGSTRERGDRHRAYYFGREIERWAEWRNAPVVTGMPTHHWNDTALCNGMLIAGIEQGHNVDRLAHAMLEAHWRDDADLADRDTLSKLANEVDLDPAPLLDAALSPSISAVYLANTEEAIRRSVFGSPTYFVDGDMFYGQDHLEFVERALVQPFAGVWPRAKG